jgi:hypothetical protein
MSRSHDPACDAWCSARFRTCHAEAPLHGGSGKAYLFRTCAGCTHDAFASCMSAGFGLAAHDENLGWGRVGMLGRWVEWGAVSLLCTQLGH